MSATTILNEILQKLSKLSDDQPNLEQLSEQEVKEEVVEPVSETTEEVKEEPTTELSEEVIAEETEVSEVEASEDEVEEGQDTELEEDFVSMEKYNAGMAAMKAEINAIKKMIDEEMGYMRKEKDRLSEQVKDLSKQPAAEAIKHSPEDANAKKFAFTYGQNRPQNTFDRVMARISNNK